ncbi:hypothetical protein ACFQ1S_43030 [Kibdelosporangium lantanae]|uniref:Gas vesicle protein n=1 Tax=Kibdelosporangium lantanae TaxID=1497396 RepID=A0ABW3MQY1_9PSEU
MKKAGTRADLDWLLDDLVGRVVSVDEVPGPGVHMRLDGTVEIEGSAKPACVAQVLYRHYA